MSAYRVDHLGQEKQLLMNDEELLLMNDENEMVMGQGITYTLIPKPTEA